MVQDWPPLNSLAWLRLSCCGAEHPTRVEDIDGDNCVVAAPMSPHTSPVSQRVADAGAFIGWAAERGALEVPVTVLEITEDRLPTWKLQAQGPGVETQRRAFVRMALDKEVKLYLLEGGAPTKATLIDISEGGMKCRVDEWALDPREHVFTSTIELEGREFNIRSQCAWWGRSDEHRNREMGIKFLSVDEKVADFIRSFIFAAQLEERRRGRR